MNAWHVDSVQFFHALVLLNFVFACAAWCLAKPTRVGAAALTVGSVLWLFLNQPLEGRTLIVLSAAHGLTESDFLSIAGLLLAAWTFRRTTGGAT